MTSERAVYRVWCLLLWLAGRLGYVWRWKMTGETLEAHIKELPLSPTAPDEESNDQ